MNNWLPRIGLVAGPLAFLAIIFFMNPDGLSLEGNTMLALTAWMAIWWTSEAIPIAGTAFLPLIILPLAGILPL